MGRNLSIPVLLSILAGCGGESQAGAPGSGVGLQERAAAGMDEAKEAIAKAVAEFQKASDETLSKLDADLAGMRDKAREATADVRTELNRSLEDLDGRREALGRKIEELRAAAPEKKEALLKELEASLESLRQAAKDAAARFE